jgi:hypothetical protein
MMRSGRALASSSLHGPKFASLAAGELAGVWRRHAQARITVSRLCPVRYFCLDKHWIVTKPWDLMCATFQSNCLSLVLAEFVAHLCGRHTASRSSPSDAIPFRLNATLVIKHTFPSASHSYRMEQFWSLVKRK